MTLIERPLDIDVLDRGEAGLRRRYLHHQVGALDAFVDAHRLAKGLQRVVGQSRIDLEGDIAVAAAAAVPDRVGTGRTRRGCPVRPGPRRSARRRCLARRARGSARRTPRQSAIAFSKIDGFEVAPDDRVVVDQLLQMSAVDRVAREEVDPHALA